MMISILGLLDPLFEAFSSIDKVLTFLVLFGLIFFFSIQIVSWITPPNPEILPALGIGLVIASLNTWAMYQYLPLGPALVRASILGVYGNWGYIWAFSLTVLSLIFMMNTWCSWSENKPLAVIQ